MYVVLQIKVFCLHPTLKRKLDQKLEIHKEKTLAEATNMAYDVSRKLLLRLQTWHMM